MYSPSVLPSSLTVRRLPPFGATHRTPHPAVPGVAPSGGYPEADLAEDADDAAPLDAAFGAAALGDGLERAPESVVRLKAAPAAPFVARGPSSGPALPVPSAPPSLRAVRSWPTPSARPSPEPAARHPSDADLARAASEGDRAAQHALFHRYVLLVRKKLRGCVGPEDLDDRTQETFLRFFERLPRLREHGAVSGFLVGIALRVAAAEIRRRRLSRLRLTEDGELPESVSAPAPDHEAKEACTRFQRILAQLDPHARAMFELRYVADMELTEIAQAMGVSLATTKRHLARISSRVFLLVERDPTLAEYWRSSPHGRARARAATRSEAPAAEAPAA